MRGLGLVLAFALALLALAGAAAGHGATMREVRQAGPFDVTYTGYDYTTEAESIRVAWTVERNATGERVDMVAAVLNVSVVDERGRVAAAYDKDLVQTTPGFVYADVLTGARGVLRLRLPLPEGHEVTFDQAVCAVDAQGQLACGLVPAGTPGPGSALLLAGAAVAAAAARRRVR